MFDRIASVYDLLNRVMTAGLDEQWRRRAADMARLGPGDSALDVCCGTGDLALELAERVGPSGSVVGCDFSERMLDLAREKADATGAAGGAATGAAGGATDGLAAGAPQARFEWADALDLPYSDGRFDAVTVGFGVRNLADLDRGLRQLTRVLRPGGRLVILEITRPQRLPLSAFFGLWFDRVVPLLGRLAGDSDAYTYLPESVRSFPPPEELAARMAAAGCEQIRYTIMAGGIISLHVGVRGGEGSEGGEGHDS